MGHLSPNNFRAAVLSDHRAERCITNRDTGDSSDARLTLDVTHLT